MNRSREYLRLKFALDFVVFDSADGFPAHGVFRHGRKDVNKTRKNVGHRCHFLWSTPMSNPWTALTRLVVVYVGRFVELRLVLTRRHVPIAIRLEITESRESE